MAKSFLDSIKNMGYAQAEPVQTKTDEREILMCGLCKFFIPNIEFCTVYCAPSEAVVECKNFYKGNGKTDVKITRPVASQDALTDCTGCMDRRGCYCKKKKQHLPVQCGDNWINIC